MKAQNFKNIFQDFNHILNHQFCFCDKIKSKHGW